MGAAPALVAHKYSVLRNTQHMPAAELPGDASCLAMPAAELPGDVQVVSEGTASSIGDYTLNTRIILCD